MKKTFLAALLFSNFFTTAFAKSPTLTLICHAALKIKTTNGVVIYIDPYTEGNYSEPADLILVTHNHDDHNQVAKVAKKDNTEIITFRDLHPDANNYTTTKKFDVNITALPAYNKNHDKNSCVGYLLEFDGIKIYHAGDTNFIDEMKAFPYLKIDYAFIPADGKYNMSAAEATKAAEAIGARYTVAIHNNAANFDVCKSKKELFKDFTPKSRLYVKYGKTIKLKNAYKK